MKYGFLNIGSSHAYLFRMTVEVEVNWATDGLFSKPPRLEFYFSAEDLPQQVSVHLAQIQSLSHVHYSPGRTCGRLVGLPGHRVACYFSGPTGGRSERRPSPSHEVNEDLIWWQKSVKIGRPFSHYTHLFLFLYPCVTSSSCLPPSHLPTFKCTVRRCLCVHLHLEPPSYCQLIRCH